VEGNSRFQIRECEFIDNSTYSVYVYAGSEISNSSVNFCTFSGNAWYDFRVSTTPYPEVPFDARWNDWGTFSSYEISEKIFDHYDDSNCPIVNFTPWLEVSLTDVIEPVGIININEQIIPQAIISNDLYYSESGTAYLEIGPDYYDSVEFLLSIGGVDTITFTSWTPEEAASHLANCHLNIEADQYLNNSAITNRFFVSKGYGPEIYAIDPNYGMINTITNTQLQGDGFDSGAIAKLTIEGESDIVADSMETHIIGDSIMEVSFNLNDAVIDQWNIEITNPNDEPYIFYNGYDVILYEGDIIPFCSWEDFVVHDGSSIQVGGIDIPRSDDIFVRIRKSNRIGHTGTWSGLIKLWLIDSMVVSASGGDDVIFHLENPPPGFYTLDINAYDPGEGVVQVCNSLDPIILGEWHIGEILRPFGTDWVQFDLDDAQAALYFQSEGFGSWSTIDVYYESISNPTQHWQFKNFGYGYHIEGEIDNPQPGRYYVKYMDSAVMKGTGGNQTRQYMLYINTEPIIEPPPLEPTITGLSTYEGGQGPVTVTVSGTGLDSSATVSLVREGYDDISAYYVEGDGVNMKLKAGFNLISADPGQWQLSVTNPTGHSDTTSSYFTINISETAELWVRILGRDLIRVGRTTPIIIQCGNNGLIDAYGIYLWIKMPSELNPHIIGFVSDSSFRCMEEDSFIALIEIPELPAKEELNYEIQVKPDSTLVFSIEAAIDSAFYMEEPPIAYVHYKNPSSNKYNQLYKNDNCENIIIRPESGIDPPVGYQIIWKFCCELDHIGYSMGNGYVAHFFDPELNNCGIPINNPSAMMYHKLSDLGDGSGCDDWVAIQPPDWSLEEAQLRADQWESEYNFSTGAWRNVEQPEYNNKEYCIGQLPAEGNCVDFAHDMWPELNNLIGIKFFKDRLKWSGPHMIFEMLRHHWRLQGCPDEVADYSCDYFKFLRNGKCLSPVNNNSQQLHTQGVTSSTPENKYGPTGFDFATTPLDSLKRFESKNRESFNYRIEFWNHDTASADAQVVTVVDTLDTDFDISTLHFTEFGFRDWIVPLEGGQYFNIDIDMRPTEDLIVNVVGSLDPDHREVQWIFRSLDPETGEPPPLIGFLPPIDTLSWNEIGWVDYEIDVYSGLMTGTEITNQCFVNFDSTGPWNPAPKDRPWINTVDAGAPVSKVDSLNEITYSTEFIVGWSGTDDSLGSGIHSYSIFVSIDGGLDEVWISDTIGTSAIFHGENDYTYAFYSIATDNVGNFEIKPPATYDTYTTINLEYLCGDPNHDGKQNIADAMYILNYVFMDGAPPDPLESAEVNCDGKVNISDAFWIVNYVFLDGYEPCDTDGDSVPDC